MLKDITLLYVEDEADILEEIEFFLKKKVKTVYTALNGEEGLASFQKYRPDLVITDIQMPRLDGLGMIEKIREVDGDVPIIITSAYNESDFLLRAINLGVDSYLLKPIRLSELMKKIDKLIEPIRLRKDLLQRNHDLYDLNVRLEDEVVYRTMGMEKERNLIKTIIDTIPASIFWKDKNFVYRGVNRYFFEKFGFKDSSAIIGKTDNDLFQKDQAQMYSENDKTIVDSKKQKLGYEVAEHHKDGSISYFLTSKVPLFNEEMKVDGIVGISQDITEKKESELKLQESEASLAVAQKIANLGNWKWNIATNELSWSDEVFRIFGEVPQSFEPTYKKFLSYLPEWERHRVEQAVNDKLEDDENSYDIVHKVVRKDGAERYVREMGIVFRDAEGMPMQMIGIVLDVTQQVEDEQKLTEQKNALAHQAHHDALTGLPNRVLFNDRLEQAISKAKRNNEQVAVFFIDLDHFKQINDSMGHDVGDEVLKIFAKRLSESVREEDTLSRMGGDEFMVMMEALPRPQSASVVAQKIITAMMEPLLLAGQVLYLTSSMGISIYPQDGENTQMLIRNADTAMYKAKSEGRNTYHFYTMQMTELAFERVLMESNLRRAIEHEEFVVFYQPQIDALTDTIIGMEALVRWQHPEMGMVSPAKFIPLAEETGLIVQIDQWMMKAAMKQMKHWYEEGLSPGCIALNLSITHLMHEGFIENLQQTLEESGCESKHIEMEVTEGQMMKNPQKSVSILRRIGALGISLAIDDFGTGYSSLSYLKRLPVNKLKIDQSFVRGLPDDEEDVAITKAVIVLAKSMHLNVIAEGVETTRQRDFLLDNGCSNIQGYLYAEPLPAKEMTRMLEEKLKN